MESKTADQLIKEIKQLLKNDCKSVKGKQIIMIVGPTGAGKTTLLNMKAGNKLICKMNEEGNWSISAENSVGLIGDNKSETLLPNYWQDPKTGNRYYDCPGFNDTRGVVVDIAKSFYLKRIVSDAKSIKIIAVSDYATLIAARCGAFGDVLKQIEKFLPGISFEVDCEFIVTKCLKKYTPTMIAKTIQSKLQRIFPPNKITLLSDPDDQTCQFPFIDVDAIVGRSSSIGSKCNLALSEEAKNTIKQMKNQVTLNIKKFIELLSEKLNLFYEGLLYENLQANNKTIKKWHQTFKNIERNIKNSSSFDKFLSILESSINSIVILGKNSIDLDIKNMSVLEKNVENLRFLMEVEAGEEEIKDWGNIFNFSYEVLSRSQDGCLFKNLESFHSFLKLKDIDPSKSIKDQIHKVLNKTHEITAKYSGHKIHSGEIPYKGVKKYEGITSYAGQVLVQGSVYYSGYVQCYSTKDYSGKIYYKKCIHTSCIACDHYEVGSPFSGTMDYHQNKHYSGNQSFSAIQKYDGIKDYHGKVQYKGVVQFEEKVHFEGKQQVKCEDHHECSCQELAQIVLAAKELLEDVQYLQNVIKIQQKRLSFVQPQTNLSVYQTVFKMKGKQLLKLSQVSDIASLIHEILVKKQTIKAKYQGETKHKIKQAYSGIAQYKGEVQVKRSVTYNGSVSYSGNVYFSGTESKKHSTTVKSCYKNCFWCTGISNRKYSVNHCVDFSGYQKYSGTQACSKTVDFQKNVPYEGEVQYVGTTDHLEVVPFEGEHQVECKEGKIGEGHHTCQSCAVWSRFTDNLINIFKVKSKYVQRIEEQTQKIKEKFKKEGVKI